MADTKNGVGWAAELTQKYGAGIANAFILHFNVQDYARGLIPVVDYLKAMLKSRDVVITYDLAGGIGFGGPDQEKLFIERLGLAGQADQLTASLGLSCQEPQKVELPREAKKALPLIEEALHIADLRVAVIITWAEHLVPAGDARSVDDRIAAVTLAKWATDPQIMANQGIVVLVTPNLSAMAEPLRTSTSRIEAITVPLPKEGERLAWIEEYVAMKTAERKTEIQTRATAAIEEAGVGLDTPEGKKLLKKARVEVAKNVPELRLDVSVADFARMTAGLALIHIEDICLRGMFEARPVDRGVVKERKAEIISREFGDVLEIMEPRWGLDMIAGHAQAKAYFQDYVITALRQGDRARAPQGVLLVGPPGTGKTAVVEAVAFEAGFNCVVLNLARILGQYVGTSERNLEKALMAIEALTPVLVFTDEIDQKLGRRSEGPSGDSGVSARLFSRVMEFMSDTSHRGRVVWLAASNRPDLLDPAFKRPGRFDAIIPLLMPVSDEERVSLFRVMFRKYGLTFNDGGLTSTEAKFQKAAQMTAGYSGAEVESVVIKANQVAGRNGREDGEISGDDLMTALAVIRTSTKDVEFMTALALAEITDLEFVPESLRSQAADRVALEAKIEGKQATRQQREL